MSSRPIFIAGGGTGGHIYPAIAVATAIRKLEPAREIIFIGSKKGLETKIVPREGFRLITLPAGKLNRSAGRVVQLATLFILPLAVLKSVWVCLRFRPRAVFGVGGYAAGPVMLVASILGFRTAIWEPNAMPGLTNRWLSRFAGTCYVVFDKARGLLKSRNVKPSGVPVRFEGGGEPVRHSKNVLIFGGSQGAHAINLVIREIVMSGDPRMRGIHWVHQIGRRDFAEFDRGYRENLSQESRQTVEWSEFLHDMERRYQWADLVICRAGASTVAELAACGKAAILIPFPQAADNHQQHNAEQLVEARAAKMILQKDLTAESLLREIVDLLSRPDLRQEMAMNIRKFHRPNSAVEIARDLLAGC